MSIDLISSSMDVDSCQGITSGSYCKNMVPDGEVETLSDRDFNQFDFL